MDFNAEGDRVKARDSAGASSRLSQQSTKIPSRETTLGERSEVRFLASADRDDEMDAAKEKAGQQGQPKLKLFESPLAHERKVSLTTFTPEPEPSVVDISGPTELAVQLSSKERQCSTPNIYDEREEEDSIGLYKERLDDAQMRVTPEFKRYEDATNLELFYDLFFVANLATFTDSHEINEVAALKAYTGFFCILWFLWLQVSLFDVRFGQDSILERVGKACQFGVMVGLAIVGTNFLPSDQEQDVFRSIAIILMISRIVLGFQYMIVLREVWNYRDSKLPLALIVGSNFLAALVYMGTFFGFKPDSPHSNVFVAWYATAITETIINIAVSSRWEVLTFAGSHLVKRMGLLTLIILGEGIIALTKSIATITKQEQGLTSALLGTITSAVVIIYFIYMIYFDWLNRDHFGSFREGLWAFLHFPFHLALVLLVEGAAQFILWRKVVEVVALVNRQFAAAEATFDSRSSADLADLFSGVTSEVFKQFRPSSPTTLSQAQKALEAIGNATFNSTDQLVEVSTLFEVIQDSLFENFGIYPPEADKPSSNDSMVEEVEPNLEWSKNMGAFRLVFIYFFVASGLTLILLNTLKIVSRPQKSWGEYSRIAIDFVVGMVLVLLATTVNTEAGFEFAQSAWILPTVAMAFVLVMALSYTKLLR